MVPLPPLRHYRISMLGYVIVSTGIDGIEGRYRGNIHAVVASYPFLTGYKPVHARVETRVKHTLESIDVVSRRFRCPGCRENRFRNPSEGVCCLEGCEVETRVKKWLGTILELPCYRPSPPPLSLPLPSPLPSPFLAPERCTGWSRRGRRPTFITLSPLKIRRL